MKKAAPKKKAPFSSLPEPASAMRTALARFLLDLLAGTNTLGVDFGKIDRLQWQGRDLGWLADDLVVECTASAPPAFRSKATDKLRARASLLISLASHGRNG